MMKTIDINGNTNLLLAGDFNVFFNTNLECNGYNPSFKQKSVAKLIEIIETFNLVISGELEILKQKGLLSDSNTVRVSYKDA